MATNYYDDVENKLNQRFETLSDRLSRIDQYNATATPFLTNQTLDFSNRPAGYNPIQDFRSAINLSEAGRTARVGAGREVTDVLGQIMSLAEQRVRAEQEARDFALRAAGLEEQMRSNRAQEEIAGLKALGSGTTSGLSGSAAVSKVRREGGGEYLSKIGSAAEREAMAIDIENAGGWREFVKTLPERELFNEKELAEQDKIVNTLSNIQDARNKLLQGNGAFGDTNAVWNALNNPYTGWLLSSKSKAAQESINKLTSEEIQRISGAATSDRERAFIETWAPSSRFGEDDNLRRLNVMEGILKVRQQLVGIAKREGLTPSQAWDKYSKQLYEQAGLGQIYGSSGNSQLDKYLK